MAKTQKPRIVSVTNSKGGVGKSTLAITLLHAAVLQGKKCILFDADLTQQTAIDFEKTRTEFKRLPSLNIKAVEVDQIASIPDLATGYDYAFIDTPGSLSKAYREAVSVADTILAPMFPGAPELWAFRKSFPKVSDMIQRDRKLVLAFYTKVPGRGSILTDLADVQQQLEDEFSVNFMDTHITARTTWTQVFFHGQTVMDATGRLRNPKASAEVAALFTELHSTLDEFYQSR